MATKTSVIPTLSLNQPLIKDRASKLAYLIKFALHNPGWTSSIIESQLVSMRFIEAKAGDDPNAVAVMLQQHLSAAMRLHDDNINVNVTVGANDTGDLRYLIRVTDMTTQQLIITSSMVKATGGDFILTAMEGING